MAQLIGISILAFPRRTEQEHTLVNKSTREVCLSTHDSICTALLPSLPYFSRPDGWLLPPRSRAHIQCILSTGLINTHFFHIWVQCQLPQPNHTWHLYKVGQEHSVYISHYTTFLLRLDYVSIDFVSVSGISHKLPADS